MPSLKSQLYSGSVFLNNTVDTLDLTGWINRTFSEYPSEGKSILRFNNDVSSLISVGDKLMKSLTNECIGVVKSLLSTNTDIELEDVPRTPLTSGDYVHIYPRFEITRVDVLGHETHLYLLWPTMSKFLGTVKPDNDSFASNSVEDFSTTSAQGQSIDSAGYIPIGTSLEGRWRSVTVVPTGVGLTHSCMCYLTPTPTII